MDARIAWIGLGNMGQAMARNIIKKKQLQHPVAVHNRTVARSEELVREVGESSAVVAAGVEDAVSASDVIFTCLANDSAIEDTMKQILARSVAGKIFVDCTTVHPDVTNALALMATENGAQFVSLTVLGSPAVAAAGQLICIASGPADAIDTIKPYINGVISRELVEFRDEPAGKADLLKLIANTFILNVNEVVAEGLTFAEKASVDPRKLHELLSALFGPLYATYSHRMVSGDYQKPKAQVPLDMALKDAHHAQKIAAAVDCAVPSLDMAERQLQAARLLNGPTADSSSIYGLLRTQSGLPFTNQV